MINDPRTRWAGPVFSIASVLFTGGYQHPLEKVNKWNKEKRLSTAFWTEKDKSFTLEYSMNLESGISEKTIKQVILYFTSILELFKTYLNLSLQDNIYLHG